MFFSNDDTVFMYYYFVAILKCDDRFEKL